MTEQTTKVVDKDKKGTGLCWCGKPLGDGHIHNDTEPVVANGHIHNDSEPAKSDQAS